MARRPAFVAAVAALALVLAAFCVVAWATVDGERGDERCHQAVLGGSTRESETPLVVRADGWSWRPFGIRCEVVDRDGSRWHHVVRPW